jgi:hypothetical protein
MNKIIKIENVLFILFFIATMHAYSQKDLNLYFSSLPKVNKDSNSISWTVRSAYPENLSTVVSGIFVSDLFRKPSKGVYNILFLDDNMCIINEGRLTEKAGELYAKYNPIHEDDTNMRFTVRAKGYGMLTRKLKYPVAQELEKGRIVSIVFEKKGIYIVKSFNKDKEDNDENGGDASACVTVYKAYNFENVWAWAKEKAKEGHKVNIFSDEVWRGKYYY